MPRSTRSPTPLLWAAGLMSILLWAGACTHVPTPQEKVQAIGQYEVGLSLVHEARRHGAAGRGSEQDLTYRRALAELKKAEKLDGTNPDIQYLLGMVYFVGFKRHDEAAVHLRKAITLRDEDYPEADHLLGTVLVDAGKPAEALPFLERARTNLMYRTPFFAEQEIGWAKYRLGRKAEAAQHLQNAIVAYPDLCGAYVRLAEVQESMGDGFAVRETLTDFLTRCDSDRLRDEVGGALLAHGYYRLAMSQIKEGAKDKAAANLRVCTDRFPKAPAARECRKSLALLE